MRAVSEPEKKAERDRSKTKVMTIRIIFEVLIAHLSSETGLLSLLQLP